MPLEGRIETVVLRLATGASAIRLTVCTLLIFSILVACNTANEGGDTDNGDIGRTSSESSSSEQLSDATQEIIERDEISHSDLSFDQAQRLTPFELVMPQAVPAAFEFESVSLRGPSDELPSVDRGPVAIFSFASSESSGALFVLEEMSHNVSLGDQSGEMSQLTIADTNVVRREQDVGLEEPVVTHLWQANDVTFVLTAQMGKHVTQEEIEGMIAAMISG